MGAFATVTIPLDLSRPGIAALALAEAENSAGSTDAAVTNDGLILKLQMPGNIRSLIGRLKALDLDTPAEVGVSVPVRSLAIPDLIPNVQHLLTTLNEEVSATALRSRLQAGDPCPGLLPPAVASYILSHHLYR